MALATIDTTELNDLLGKGQAVVVDFWAEWCRPCHALTPEIEALAVEHVDVRFVKLDIDANPEITAKLGVMSVPTVVHFGGDGAEVARSIGAMRREQLADRLRLNGSAS